MNELARKSDFKKPSTEMIRHLDILVGTLGDGSLTVLGHPVCVSTSYFP